MVSFHVAVTLWVPLVVNLRFPFRLSCPFQLAELDVGEDLHEGDFAIPEVRKRPVFLCQVGIFSCLALEQPDFDTLKLIPELHLVYGLEMIVAPDVAEATGRRSINAATPMTVPAEP